MIRPLAAKIRRNPTLEIKPLSVDALDEIGRQGNRDYAKPCAGKTVFRGWHLLVLQRLLAAKQLADENILANRASEAPSGPQPLWVGLRRMADFATAWLAFGPKNDKVVYK